MELPKIFIERKRIRFLDNTIQSVLNKFYVSLPPKVMFLQVSVHSGSLFRGDLCLGDLCPYKTPLDRDLPA